MMANDRTDKAIQQDVQDELEWDPLIGKMEIAVRVIEGVVTLEGQVEHYSQKYAAERAALRTAGVRAIANDIRVAGRLANDTEIAVNIVRVLEAHTDIPVERIKVLVQDGQVTLSGSVDWQEQRSAAETLVRHVRGVVSVIDDIKIVQPVASATEIRGGIERAFARHARLDASKVSIAVHDGHLTLSGSVSSLAEREEAEAAAWRAKGVTDVTNLIKVEAAHWE